MNDHLQAAVEALEARFEVSARDYAGEMTLIIGAEHILEAAQTLRDEFQFEMLVDETAVDYWPQLKPRFHLIYQLYSMANNVLLRLRVPLNGNAPHVETVEKIYPNANWKSARFGTCSVSISMALRYAESSCRKTAGASLRKDYPRL